LATPFPITGLAGLVGGILIGFLVQRARLCTFGAMEDAMIGRDFRRLKVFGLALAVALAVTQGLILAGDLDPDRTTYLPTSLPIAGIVLGGLAFGLGMALVGTCGFGSLVRLGTGDLRALIVIMVFGVFAYAALRGVLAGFRIGLVEQVAFPMPGPTRSDWPTPLQRWLGIDPRLWLTLLVALPLALVALLDPRLRRARRLMTAGVGLGLVVGLGWAATGWWSDPFDLHQRVQSLTFVAPVARALFGVLAGQDAISDFGVASVVGVVAGAAASSLRAGEFRCEAFDDQREMRRHLLGAALMGLGGVLAGGCTIGQGLAAGSLMALSMPLAIIAMMIGARFGMAILMGEARDWFARR
jgi:hypothetical protein